VVRIPLDIGGLGQVVTGFGLFAGRKREMSGLRAALDSRPPLVLVAGDAGVGKTRLVRESLRLIAAEGPLSVWGTCLPLAEQLPFLPIAEALDALSRIDDGALLHNALATIPPYALEETACLLPHLQSADTGSAGRPAGWQRERMFAGIAELLAAAARPSGLALVIDDVQWADSATLDFLTFLTRAGRAELVTVVATVRSDETPLKPAVSRWLGHTQGSGHVQEIRLSPLARDEAAEQAAGLMGDQTSAADLDELFDRCEGNPFFTEQLVADALAGREHRRRAAPGPPCAAGRCGGDPPAPR
jgi:predicted ATPase